MRTKADAGALFYIGSVSPKAVKEKFALSTGMALSIRKPLVEKLQGMGAGRKISRLGNRHFEVVKRRHDTPACGSFSVFDIYLIAPEFAKAKKTNEARLG